MLGPSGAYKGRTCYPIPAALRRADSSFARHAVVTHTARNSLIRHSTAHMPRYHSRMRSLPTSAPLDSEQLLTRGRRVLATEVAAVQALEARLDGDFVTACQLVHDCRGRVVVTGMGKSGHIGNKIAATLASTGTPAFFLHPAEASHGDMGMITHDDVVVAISNSGETAELLTILPGIKRLGVPLIAMTGKLQSTLAKAATAVLDVSVPEEACPHNLAPTASTTATLAMGDALAVAVLEARGFQRGRLCALASGRQPGTKAVTACRRRDAHRRSIAHGHARTPRSRTDCWKSAARASA